MNHGHEGYSSAKSVIVVTSQYSRDRSRSSSIIYETTSTKRPGSQLVIACHPARSASSCLSSLETSTRSLTRLGSLLPEGRAVSKPDELSHAITSDGLGLPRNHTGNCIVSAQDAALSPATAASRTQRVAKALRVLARKKEDSVAVQKIHQDIDFLVLHKTTLAELSE